MLKSISIKNYTLINSLEINFEAGFSVITGETGAGKSIIIGALSLVLGKRADLNVIKDKSKKCIIEGVFDNDSLHLKKYFAENDLDYEEQTIIRREILPSGKSRAFINDTPVNLTVLNKVGSKFVNIHSQHQTLQLSDTIFQLNVLDDYAGKPKFLLEYQKVYALYNSLSVKLDDLIDQNNKAIKDEDYFNFQFNELNAASLNADDIIELEKRAQFLQHTEEIKSSLSQAEDVLNNGSNSVITSLQYVSKDIFKIEHYLPEAKEIANRLDSVLIELNDLYGEIVSLNGNDNFDPLELQLVTDKLSNVYSLIQKHRVQTVDELISVRNDYEAKLLNITLLDEEISNVKSEILVIEKELKSKASQLHKVRFDAGEKFSLAIIQVLKQLGMKDAQFAVKIEHSQNYTASGTDKVFFMFSANLGSQSGEISKVASGGELSRLMLAVKSLISKKQLLPTIIFDEIDTGVSGEVAGKVGDILKKMAQKHQVISISHLPQIASKAHYHYKVYKQIENNSTTSVISLLNNNDRVEEIAKMLSSDKVTETALSVARELLDG